MTDDERSAALKMVVGMTWDEIAATHDMKCGACRDGTLALAKVTVIQAIGFDTLEWLIEDGFRGVRRWRDPVVRGKTVTLDLKCAVCGATITLPLHATE